MVLRRLTGSNHPAITFIAAFAGGYLVFGKNNKINMQVSYSLENPGGNKIFFLGNRSTIGVEFEGGLYSRNVQYNEWNYMYKLYQELNTFVVPFFK